MIPFFVNKFSSRKDKTGRNSPLDIKRQPTLRTSPSFRNQIAPLTSGDFILMNTKYPFYTLILQPAATLIAPPGVILDTCKETHTQINIITNPLFPVMVHIITFKDINKIQTTYNEEDKTEYSLAQGWPEYHNNRLYSNKIFISVFYFFKYNGFLKNRYFSFMYFKPITLLTLIFIFNLNIQN